MRRGISWVVVVALVVGLLALALLLYVWFFSDRLDFQLVRPLPVSRGYYFLDL